MSGFDIIVLSWDNYDLTQACISRITKYAEKPVSLIIVDNGSKHPGKLLSELKRDTTVVFNYENKGFAGGVNQGIKLSSAPYVFLLNNDVMWQSGWGEEVLNEFRRNKNLGILGELEVFERARIEKHLRLNGLKWKGAVDLQFSNISGHVMIISRKVINKIGLFDEQFYPGLMEDVDYSIRAVRAGFKIKQIPARFKHLGNKTLFSKYSSSEITDIVADTSRRLFLKHYKDRLINET